MSLFEKLFRQRTMAEDKKKRKNMQEELMDILQENMDEAKQQYPDNAAQLDAFLPLVKKNLMEHIPQVVLEEDEEEPEDGTLEPTDASPVFFIAEDRMTAFACILPPLNHGAYMSLSSFREDLRYSGIAYGIDEHLIARMINDREYLNPFPVARGIPSRDGKDGVITDNFERRQALKIEVDGKKTVDFSQEDLVQTVHKGDVLCRIQAAAEAQEGKDVTGRALYGKNGNEVHIVEGENTQLSQDGGQLLASIDGIVTVTEQNDFCIRQQRVIRGSVGPDTGDLTCEGDLFISGDVRGGVSVEATGTIIVAGKAEDASITAGGSIRIQQGVKGRKKAVLIAERQVQCAVLENATVKAGDSVFAEVIMNSDITSGRSVYILSGRGLLIGGHVKARDDIEAREIGNLSECLNCVSVGYHPGLREKINTAEDSLTEANETLEKLRKNVSILKALGNQISQEKRNLLAQLIEQKKLYEEKANNLTNELKTLRVTVHQTQTGTIVCEKLFPTTEIHMGEKKAVIHNSVTDCKIHLQGDNILTR